MKLPYDKPTKEGWYWYDPGDEWPEKKVIYFVDKDLDVWLDYHGYVVLHISKFDGKWTGPIPDAEDE